MFYSISLKYTTQAQSYKNQKFLRLKYMPAEMINLRKNIFSSKVRPQNNQYVVLNIRDICNINTTSLTQVTYLCFIGSFLTEQQFR